MIHKNNSSMKSKIVKNVFFTLYTAGVLLMAPIQSSAGEGPPGLPFLRISMDARGSALAGAMTASGTGIASLQWNPAGLAGGYDHEVLFSHLKGIENTDSEFIAMLLKKGEKSTFAFSVFSNSIDGIEQRSQPTLTPNGIIGANDFYAGLSYAYVINEQLHIGASAKYLFQKIFFSSANGFAGDVGIRYLMPDKNLIFGIALKNAGTMDAFILDKPTMPTLLNGGAAYTIPQFSIYESSLTVSAEYEILFNGDNISRFGVEYLHGDRYSLRAGYLSGFEERNLSMGAGINIRKFGFDYAYMPDITSFGNQHIFSLRLKI
jgi:hypothetical protein